MDDDGNEIPREIDYVNLRHGIASEFTISSRHNACFDLLPKHFQCTLLTKNENGRNGSLIKEDYCTYIHRLSCERYRLRHPSKAGFAAPGVEMQALRRDVH